MGGKVDSGMYIIGIDPGVMTGLAVYCKEDGLKMFCLTISRAMSLIKSLKAYNSVNKVVVEDARKRTWYGNNSNAKLQGAGSIKRDCQIWEDFLTEQNIPFEMKHPIKGGTKIDRKLFNQYWQGFEVAGKNNEHTRDAAMLIRSEVK